MLCPQGEGLEYLLTVICTPHLHIILSTASIPQAVQFNDFMHELSGATVIWSYDLWSLRTWKIQIGNKLMRNFNCYETLKGKCMVLRR